MGIVAGEPINSALHKRKMKKTVEKVNILENVRNGVDGQKTDENASEPSKTTYADIVKKRTYCSVSLLKVRRGKATLPPLLTFKKDSHRKNSLIDFCCRSIP